MHAALHCLIHIANGRLVVADDQQLELRYELKEVLPHETRSDLVAPSQRLKLAFCPTAALFGLNGGDHARSAQSRHIGWMPIAVARHKHVHGRDGCVIPKDFRQRICKNGFAVGPSPVEEKERMLAGNACEAVARHTLQVGLKLGIAARDRIQEIEPCRAAAFWRCSGDLRHAKRLFMGL